MSWPKINHRTEVEEYGLIIEQPEKLIIEQDPNFPRILILYS